MQKVTVPIGQSGPWAIQKFKVGDMEALLSFTRDRKRGVLPGTYTRLVHEDRGVIMSDTQAEMADHSLAVEKATGSVLINGLGLGMVLLNVLLKEYVTDVTVVEYDKHVIDLVASHYQSDPRVTIVHASAYDYEPPAGKRYNVVWHDIWDTISPEDIPDMNRLHRKYRRRTDWQGSWARPQAEAMLKVEGMIDANAPREKVIRFMKRHGGLGLAHLLP